MLFLNYNKSFARASHFFVVYEQKQKEFYSKEFMAWFFVWYDRKEDTIIYHSLEFLCFVDEIIKLYWKINKHKQKISVHENVNNNFNIKSSPSNRFHL